MEIMQLRQARNLIWTFLFSLSFCCVFTGMAFAQVDQGAINGVVKDTKGAVVQGALVTLTNTDTNFSLQKKSGQNGEYTFSPIKIGHYMLSATAPKFATTTQENITVNIQDVLNISLTLRLGGVTENVTVTSAPPLLQSETSSVGQVVDTEAIMGTNERRVAEPIHHQYSRRQLIPQLPLDRPPWCVSRLQLQHRPNPLPQRLVRDCGFESRHRLRRTRHRQFHRPGLQFDIKRTQQLGRTQDFHRHLRQRQGFLPRAHPQGRNRAGTAATTVTPLCRKYGVRFNAATVSIEFYPDATPPDWAGKPGS